MPTSRGIRNNNPGNLDYHANIPWVGQLGIETGVANPRFARFDTMENGIRALARNLLTYFGRGLDTVSEIINRWAPSNENNTRAYAQAVARELGVGVNAQLNLRDASTLQRLTTAIIRHENGGLGGISGTTISAGVARALGGSGAGPFSTGSPAVTPPINDPQINPGDPGLFGWNPGFDYSIGGTDFSWNLDTALDRLFGRDGADLGDAGAAAGDIAGAAGGAVVNNIAEQLEPWVGRVSIIVLALILIGGGIFLFSSGGGQKIVLQGASA